MKRIYISTIQRESNFEKEDHGFLYLVDWDTKTIIKRLGSFPSMCSRDSTNPRGGIRGWRGLAYKDKTLIAANNDSLVYFDEDLEQVKKIVSHPLFVDLHGICFDNYKKDLFVTSTGVDSICVVKQDEVQILKLFKSLPLENILEKHLYHRGRKSFVPEDNFDYRFVKREDTLHLNACSFNPEGDLFAIFSSISTFCKFDNKNQVFSIVYSINPKEVTSGGELPNMHDLKFIDNINVLSISSSFSELFLINTENSTFKSIFKNTKIAPGDNEKLKRSWLRGLDYKDGYAFVGCGDVTLIRVDVNNQEEIESYTFSDGNRESIFSILLHPEDW